VGNRAPFAWLHKPAAAPAATRPQCIEMRLWQTKDLQNLPFASVLGHGDEREVRNVKRDNRVLNLAVRGYKAVL